LEHDFFMSFFHNFRIIFTSFLCHFHIILHHFYVISMSFPHHFTSFLCHFSSFFHDFYVYFCHFSRAISQRGVALIASCHGTCLADVLRDPALSALLGGVTGGWLWLCGSGCGCGCGCGCGWVAVAVAFLAGSLRSF
jgi:hypothetical protein